MGKKHFLFIVLVAGVALIAFYFFHKYRMAPEINIKQLGVLTENGEPFDMNALRGKKLIVSFYASWCGNCIQELREINKIKAAELSDVELVCITDEPIEKLLEFKERTGYPFLFLKLQKQFPEIGIHSIPVTYIVNQDMEVEEEHVGYIDWNDASTLNHIKSLYK